MVEKRGPPDIQCEVRADQRLCSLECNAMTIVYKMSISKNKQVN